MSLYSLLLFFQQVQGLEEDLVRERDGLEKTRASLMEKNTKLEQDLEVGSGFSCRFNVPHK